MIGGLSVLLAVTACSREGSTPEPGTTSPARVEPLQPVILPGDDQVLARVNGSPITRFELDQAIAGVLGDGQSGLLDAAGRRRVLESLVASRAMAQAAARGLDAQARARLDRQTDAYREQVLVRLYLSEHTEPQIVTDEMVQVYYEANPRRFGARTVRSYEALVTERRVAGEKRRQALDAFSSASDHQDWEALALSLRDQGLPVERRAGEVDPGLLHPRLRDALKVLAPGEGSRPFLVDGKPYVVRIVAETQRAPRPLEEVSAEIRRMLAPIQLRKAISASSDAVLETADVEYLEPEGPL